MTDLTESRMDHEKTPLNRRERLNRNIMLIIVLMGVVAGLVLGFISDHRQESHSVFDIFTDESPLPVSFTIAFAIFWGIVMPVVAWIWHRKAIDELEAAAYRDGGYYAAYTFIIVVPAWWILWRGGLLPEPHGVAIFLAFNMIWLITWFWKKYR